MMKTIFFALLLLPTFALAQVEQAEVKNFNFKYRGNLGDGSASSFQWQDFNELETVKLEVEKIEQNFQIKVRGSEERDFVFQDAPGFLTNAETITIKGFNLLLREKAALSLNQGDFISHDNEMHLQNLKLDCARIQTHQEILDQLLHGCVQKMSLKASRFNGLVEGETLSGIISSIEIEGVSLSGADISNLDMQVKTGNYDLSVEVKAQISGKVKSNGNIQYDSARKKLTIRIDEVKFGFLNITSKVFTELKAKETDKMKVQKPYVYLSLK